LAVTLDRMQEGPAAVADWLIPMEKLLPALPAIVVTGEGRTRVSHGRELEREHYSPAVAGTPAWVRVQDADGRLLALAGPGSAPGSLHPSIVLN
jgi:hypothetical protein